MQIKAEKGALLIKKQLLGAVKSTYFSIFTPQ